MRDNTLAAALLRKKRDVTLIPVYSPIRTDEPNVSSPRVLYGGINVYLQQKSTLFRRAPRFLDRLLDAPRLLNRAMRNADGAKPDDLGALTVSILRGADGAQKKEMSKLIDALRDPAPDLIHLPNAMFVGLARPLHEALGAAIACSLTGEDIFLESLTAPHREEAFTLIRRAVPDVHAFIAVTRNYRQYARDAFSIPDDRLHYVPLGISVDDAHAKPDGEESVAIRGDSDARSAPPFTIGYLARICPEKGLHQLADAFTKLHRRGRVCRLRIAGYLPASARNYLQKIMDHLRSTAPVECVELLGEVDRPAKLAMLRSCDVLSVPTVYKEAKGIYVLEALSHGVPVVQPAHGSFPELIEDTGGGLLFPPGDTDALAGRIERLMDDAALRRELGRRGRAAVIDRHHDELMADRAWQVFEDASRKYRRSLAE